MLETLDLPCFTGPLLSVFDIGHKYRVQTYTYGVLSRAPRSGAKLKFTVLGTVNQNVRARVFFRLYFFFTKL